MYAILFILAGMILCPVNNLRDPEAIRLFGRRLRQMRLDRNLTMDDLAHQCGLSYSQLARIELGEINTTISTVFAIARGMDVSPSQFFEFNLPPRPPDP